MLASCCPTRTPRPLRKDCSGAAFINSGQTCACLKRLYVHDSIYDDVCRELTAYASPIAVGDGLTEASTLGPATEPDAV